MIEGQTRLGCEGRGPGRAPVLLTLGWGRRQTRAVCMTLTRDGRSSTSYIDIVSSGLARRSAVARLWLCARCGIRKPTTCVPGCRGGLYRQTARDEHGTPKAVLPPCAPRQL
eukprot:4835258-Prymnesium_polylepis.2